MVYIKWNFIKLALVAMQTLCFVSLLLVYLKEKKVIIYIVNLLKNMYNKY